MRSWHTSKNPMLFGTQAYVISEVVPLYTDRVGEALVDGWSAKSKL